MEQTMEAQQEQRWRRAVEQLAGVVRDLAEERHEAKGHPRDFLRCDEPTCEHARSAYHAL